MLLCVTQGKTTQFRRKRLGEGAMVSYEDGAKIGTELLCFRSAFAQAAEDLPREIKGRFVAQIAAGISVPQQLCRIL